MNSPDIRSLQEAYSRVYAPQELDEIRGIDGHINPNTGKSSYGLDSGLAMTPKKRMETRANSLQKKGEGKRANKIRAVMKRPSMGESYDLYDVILSHLLDEGYADTQEQAESIMGNMSEEWKQSIIEEKEPDVLKYAEWARLRGIAYGSKKFQDGLKLSPSNPNSPNFDPKTLKTPGV